MIFAKSFVLGLVAWPSLAYHKYEGNNGAVYIMSNGSRDSDVGSNAIIVFDRSVSSGDLHFVGKYPTGGFGGTAQAPPDDPLGSQGGLSLSESKRCLFAVNAGSNSISTFKIDKYDATFLKLTDVDSTFGDFPASVAQYDDLVYVLNAGGKGSIIGYKFDSYDCTLEPISRSKRRLDLDNDDPPFFVFSPAQIGFTPDGEYIVVTNKGPDGGRGTIILYAVRSSGRPSSRPSSVTESSGYTPFSFDFDDRGRLLVSEAFGASNQAPLPPIPDAGAVSSYRIRSDGSLKQISISVPTGQTTTCWLKYNNGYAVTTNNGASSLSILKIRSSGRVKLEEDVAASTDENIYQPIDLDFSPDGKYLYVLSTGHIDSDGQPDVVIFRNRGNKLELIGDMAEGIPNEDETEYGVVGIAVI